MAKAIPDTQDGAKTATKVDNPGAKRMRPIWPISQIKRKLQERNAERERETPEQKAARRTATATWWIAVFTIILAAVSSITLYLVYEGGSDTAKLAQAAVDQATALQLQEQRMETVAATGTIQAQASLDAANAAKSAAETASAALKQSEKAFTIEQRPYLIGEGPVWVTQPAVTIQSAVNLYFKDIGKTPAVKVERHMALVRHKGLPRTDPRGTDAYVAFIQGAFRDLEQEFTRVTQERYAALLRHDIAPGERIFSTATDADPPLTQAEMADLATGAIDLRLIAMARYTDAFNGVYETEFCWYYFGTDPNTWHICDSHNVIK